MERCPVCGKRSCLVGDRAAAAHHGWFADVPWWSYDLQPRVWSAILFSVGLRDVRPSFRHSSVPFAQLALGCSNPSPNCSVMTGLMRDVPHHEAAPVRVRYKNVFTPRSFCPSSHFYFSLSFFRFTSSSSLSFLQRITINSDLHLRIIQTLCLHLSRSTPLRKTLTVNLS